MGKRLVDEAEDLTSTKWGSEERDGHPSRRNYPDNEDERGSPHAEASNHKNLGYPPQGDPIWMGTIEADVVSVNSGTVEEGRVAILLRCNDADFMLSMPADSAKVLARGLNRAANAVDGGNALDT